MSMEKVWYYTRRLVIEQYQEECQEGKNPGKGTIVTKGSCVYPGVTEGITGKEGECR